MSKMKILVTITLFLILSSSVFAQVEHIVKETKIKVEKAIDKASAAKEMMSGKIDDMKTRKCGADSKKACCSTEAKEMKAEIKKHGTDCKCEGCSTASATMEKGEKMMEKVHLKGCDCEGCKTASASMHEVHKKAHTADCDCEGCKVAHAEMKEQKHKAHPKDCSCEGCKKS